MYIHIYTHLESQRERVRKREREREREKVSELPSRQQRQRDDYWKFPEKKSKTMSVRLVMIERRIRSDQIDPVQFERGFNKGTCCVKEWEDSLLSGLS